MLRVTLLAALAATASAFVTQPTRLAGAKLAFSKAAASRAAVAAAPAAVSMSLAGPTADSSVAFASSMSTAMGLEVNFGAFLAVILGLLVPTVFLIILFIKVSRARATRRRPLPPRAACPPAGARSAPA
jgi:photosystem II PsbM protein